MSKDIKVIRLEIRSYDSFYWNLKSYPREVDKDGNLVDTVLIYLDSPSKEVIAKVINTVALEFSYSFDTSYSAVYKFRSMLVEALLKSVGLDENGDFITDDSYRGIKGFCSIELEERGGFGLSLELLDYRLKEVKIANTGEVITVGELK